MTIRKSDYSILNECGVKEKREITTYMVRDTCTNDPIIKRDGRM